MLSRNHCHQILNGVIAVPIMVVMMILANRPSMSSHMLGPRLRLLGWIALPRWRDRDRHVDDDVRIQFVSLLSG